MGVQRVRTIDSKLYIEEGKVALYLPFVPIFLAATLGMMGAQGVSDPAPLDRMAQALAAAHSYRVISTSDESIDHHRTSRIVNDITVVRQATIVHTYRLFTISTAAGGQTWSPVLTTEQVDTGNRTCQRVVHATAWQCAPHSLSTPAAARRAAQTPPLHTLRWTRLPNALIRGQFCLGYQTTWQPDARHRTRAMLWLALGTARPVELRAVESTNTIAEDGRVVTTSTTETAVWSDWNSPALRVPRP